MRSSICSTSSTPARFITSNRISSSSFWMSIIFTRSSKIYIYRSGIYLCQRLDVPLGPNPATFSWLNSTLTLSTELTDWSKMNNWIWNIEQQLEKVLMIPINKRKKSFLPKILKVVEVDISKNTPIFIQKLLCHKFNLTGFDNLVHSRIQLE